MKCSEEEMWQAIVACDTGYDEKFCYVVKTVGVYCRPSCKSRTPLRKNVLFFSDAEEAAAAGFRPCKRCRPDILSYAPMQKVAEQVKELIDKHYCEKELLTAEIKRLGVSLNRISTVFRQEYGLSPVEYIGSKKIEHAKKLLSETDTPIIDIAGDIGFNSLAAFYTFFKRHTGLTPKKYRKEIRL